MDHPPAGQVATSDVPRRGWWSRNRLWFVPAAVLGAGVLCGGFWLGIRAAPFVALKSSEPYAMAFERVRRDPQVIEQLGEPIEAAGWFPSGEVNLRNGGGNARLEFTVTGPLGTARVHAGARRLAGRWGLNRLEITTEDGRRIVPELSGGGGLDDAPLFRP